MQYNLNKVQTICIFCSKWWQSRLNALSTSSRFFFFIFGFCLFLFFLFCFLGLFLFCLFLVLEVCILTILINQLALIETRIATSLYGSQTGGPVVGAQGRARCVRGWEVGVRRKVFRARPTSSSAFRG